MIRLLLCQIPIVILLLTTVSCGEKEKTIAYVSLGDSLAVGVGASKPEERGYAALYRDALQKRTGQEVRFIQLGVSGETTESFIGNHPDGNPQLVRAERALRRNPGARVTLSIGANDLLRTSDATGSERSAVLARYRKNLRYILQNLKTASDPPPQITVLALYNPDPGSFTDRWTGRLNREIRRVSADAGVAVANGDQAFRGHEQEYIHNGDIHPTDRGYRALTRAFLRASNLEQKPGEDAH